MTPDMQPPREVPRLRVLLAVTHLLGAGHLTRMAAIGRALAQRGHDATIASGGMPSPLIRPDGCRLVQLPPVRAAVDDFTTLRDETLQPIGPDRLEARRGLLLGTLADVRPDVVVTELYPFGRRALSAEFDALIEAAGAMRPRPLVLSSVRDILVAPGRPDKAAATHAKLARDYRAVLVHGDPRLVPLEASWPLDPTLASRLIYTGYVGSEPPAVPAGAPEIGAEGVLVSGGSSAASLPLYRAALAAARLLPDLRWRVLVGAGVADAAFDELRSEAPDGVAVERARPDFVELMARAAVFVGQAGYNTVMDIVATRARAVLVPFEEGRETEQRMRAESLAARGWVDLLTQASLTGPALAATVEAARRRPRPDPSPIELRGGEATARIIEQLAGPVAAGRTAVA